MSDYEIYKDNPRFRRKGYKKLARKRFRLQGKLKLDEARTKYKGTFAWYN